MVIIEDLNTFKADCGYAAAIGFFDGLHIGHKALIGKLKEEASARGLKTLIVTFAQHPRELMHASYVPKLLTTKQERIALLEQEGIDICYVIKKNDVFSMSSAYFLKSVLAAKLNVKYLLVGYDHHFGCDREKGYDYYKVCGADCGVEVEQFGAVSVSDNHLSSSTIRHLIEDGKIDNVNKFLGYNYTIGGTVVHGRSLGKTIGFPTANVAINDVRKLIPKEGVYSVKVTLEGEKKAYKGVLNIGVRPTFINLGSIRTIEVHILKFDGDIYQRKINVEFLKFLRAEEKFDNPQLLARQIEKDCKNS
ncbi:MAG: bifunctional riboflavin kinase/FAD synthetase [Paludibacteraceae bacterium]|nr:bifunctional riboflavin kinase/FAD synthetase [Paludibacteraceae bacterium]